MKPLTKYQKKVLAAALAIEEAGAEYWTSDVVQSVIQTFRYGAVREATLWALIDAGLITTQADDLPAELRGQLLCNCAEYHYRLTQLGRETAGAWNIFFDDAARQQIEEAVRYMDVLKRIACGATPRRRR